MTWLQVIWVPLATLKLDTASPADGERLSIAAVGNEVLNLEWGSLDRRAEPVGTVSWEYTALLLVIHYVIEKSLDKSVLIHL